MKSIKTRNWKSSLVTVLILSASLGAPTSSASSRRFIPFTRRNNGIAFKRSSTQDKSTNNRRSQGQAKKQKYVERDQNSSIDGYRKWSNFDKDEIHSKHSTKISSKLLDDDYSMSNVESNLPVNSDADVLQIPLSIALQHDSSSGKKFDMRTFLDTGAQRTIMTFQAAERAGIAHLIDKGYRGQAAGVAGVSCRVVGRIPARTVTFSVQDRYGTVVLDSTPAITILQDQILGYGNHNGVDILLGLDALEEWKGTLCLFKRTLTVRDAKTGSHEAVIIPLLNKSKLNTVMDASDKDKIKHKKYEGYLGLNADEEDEYSDEKYYYVESEDDYDECDLSGV